MNAELKKEQDDFDAGLLKLRIFINHYIIINNI